MPLRYFRHTLARFRSVPIRVVLTVPFVLQLVAAVGLTGWLSFRNGQHAVQDLAGQLMGEVSDRIQQRLTHYLLTPQRINQMNARAIELGILQPADLTRTGQYFWQQVQTFEVDYVAFGAANGNFIGSGQLNSGSFVIDQVSATETDNDLHAYTTDAQGNRIEQIEVIPHWDHRTEAVYQTVVRTGQAIWSDVYEWKDGSGVLAISAGQPIYDATQGLIGVLSVDLRLTTISEFLDSLNVGRTGESFILERNGLIVASSTAEAPISQTENRSVRLTAQQSQNPLVEGVTDQLIEQFHSLTAIQTSQQLLMTVNYERVFVQVSPFTDDSGLNWLVVVVVPEANFMEQIRENNRTAILLCLLALVVAIAVGLETSKRMTRPILRMIQAANALSRGEWQQQLPESRLAEVNALTQVFNHMADQLQQLFAKLHYVAYHDPLTNLPNRAALLERLERAIAQAQHNPDQLFAILFLDLDSFKLINDSLGHTVGDRLLIAVSRRLRYCLSTNATVARLGGDEFVVLLEEITGIEEAIQAAEQILQSLNQAIAIGDASLFISASIGIVLSTVGSSKPSDCLRNADIAMYHAKAEGKARYEVFDHQMHAQTVERLQLETDLRQGLEQGEFEVHYQPIVSTTEQLVLGFEALVRWHHPTQGWVSPGKFIPVAEETGLINPLGWWVLQQACQQMAQWRSQTCSSSLFISVNLSVKQLIQPDLLERITSILQQTGLAACCLKLEITESMLISNTDVTNAKLQRLKAEGIRLNIDDFGTGYSSLSHLHQFPLDTLKIDRSFVKRLTTQDSSVEIIRAIIVLAHALGMNVVAEGVETPAQLEHLRRLGCEQMQGFLFSPALPAIAATDLLLLSTGTFKSWATGWSQSHPQAS